MQDAMLETGLGLGSWQPDLFPHPGDRSLAPELQNYLHVHVCYCGKPACLVLLPWALYFSTCCNTCIPSPAIGVPGWAQHILVIYLCAFPAPNFQLLPAAESTAVTPAPNLRFSLRLSIWEEGVGFTNHILFGIASSVISDRASVTCQVRIQG